VSSADSTTPRPVPRLLSGLRRLWQYQRVGPGAIAVQITGDHNVVMLAGEARLCMESRHARRTEPRNLRELMWTQVRALDRVGREEELAALRRWMAATRPDRDISVHCLTGRAGAGKTRLAIELCEWAEQAGWSAGFVSHDALAVFHAHHNASEWRWPTKTLVVIDYAAASVKALRSYFEAFARGAPAPNEPPLRILLLERHADRDAGWWSTLIRPGGISGPGPATLVHAAAPLPLGPIRSIDDRRALLAQAMRLAAPLLETPRPPPPQLPPLGTDPLFDARLADDTIDTEPLFLVMAGIAAVEKGASNALAQGRLDLANDLADAESGRLQRLARASGADDSLLLHLAACVTLQAGCNLDIAYGMIDQEREALGDRSTTRTDELAALLHNALPPSQGDGIDAVRPDLIGEAFLLKELRPPPRQIEAVERAFGRARQSVIATLVRTAQDHADGAGSHASVMWLTQLAGLMDDPLALMAIGDELPLRSLALGNYAVTTSRRIVDGLAKCVTAEPGLLVNLATAANNLSVRLGQIGDLEGAVTAARKSIDIRRSLAAKHPESRSDLAGSLLNIATTLSATGDLEGAVAAARESVEIYSALAKLCPEKHRSNLASALNALAAQLLHVSDHRAALSAASESVSILRTLATLRPDEFRSYLAASLNTLAWATLGSDLSRSEESLSAAREAVDLYRALAAQRPDTYRPDLATALHTLAAMLIGDGARGDALSVACEAVDVRRALAEQQPEAFNGDLAKSLNNLAFVQRKLGNKQPALSSAEEAVHVLGTLAAQRPDEFLPELARALSVLADCLDDVDRQDDGLAANAKAIALLTVLFRQNPHAFAAWIETQMQAYIQRCEVLRREPDQLLLAPVVAGLAQVQADGPTH
jgi:tetratricopeptide (TPR) repeat protein